MKNYNPSCEPQMLGKVLVVLQNDENASDVWKPFSAAAGSNVFCQCFHAGVDWKFMAGIPFVSLCGAGEIPTAARQ